MIPRIIRKQVVGDLFQGKAIIITGPRQVGKTTLLESIRAESGMKWIWLNCDEPDIRVQLENVTSTQLRVLVGDARMVFIDEAQRIRNIGLTLKLIVDTMKEVQVIATGSSALELANEINEPLTGRKREYHLFPLCTAELVQASSKLDEQRLLEQRLIYGCYPDIINHPGQARTALKELSDTYLYKDLLSLQEIRKPVLLEKLVTALALQVGSEVVYQELAQTIGADSKTAERYIQLLEKCFIIFQVSAFSRNLRNEIKKGKKIYFYDNGIRNAVIKNFNPLSLRQDVGALWENFMMSERMKSNRYANRFVNNYFWRTHAQQEIDMIEEAGGQLNATEFKWKPRAKEKLPKSFAEAYPEANFTCITPANYMEYLIG
ncbi:MAG: ATP-binding protein [Bacteroidetes bacterium CHB5]|nr:ATP-binding protein [Bacteroidetes bacterium CHB5]